MPEAFPATRNGWPANKKATPERRLPDRRNRLLSLDLEIVEIIVTAAAGYAPLHRIRLLLREVVLLEIFDLGILLA